MDFLKSINNKDSVMRLAFIATYAVALILSIEAANVNLFLGRDIIQVIEIIALLLSVATGGKVVQRRFETKVKDKE